MQNMHKGKKLGFLKVGILSTVLFLASGSYADRDSGDAANALCPGGVSSLSHVLDENATIFPGDPETEINVFATVEEFGFLAEEITLSTHTSTHLDVPVHFVAQSNDVNAEQPRSLDQIEAKEFIWHAYVIDVRDRIQSDGPDFRLTKKDIRRYERRNGRIKKDSMVIIQTGQDEKFGTQAYADDRIPGFSIEAVQWMFDKRNISGVGSDTFGPDASLDTDGFIYPGTDTALRNDGFALPGLTNLDSISKRGDIIIAPAVRLGDGSGYQVNPLGCKLDSDDEDSDDDD